MSLGGNQYKHSRRSYLSQTAAFLILCHHKIRASLDWGRVLDGHRSDQASAV
jgi:hypothetical protein